jgi:hypothetical protein
LIVSGARYGGSSSGYMDVNAEENDDDNDDV